MTTTTTSTPSTGATATADYVTCPRCRQHHNLATTRKIAEDEGTRRKSAIGSRDTRCLGCRREVRRQISHTIATAATWFNPLPVRTPGRSSAIDILSTQPLAVFDESRCTTHPDAADWTSDSNAAVTRAKTECLSCPAIVACLKFAINNPASSSSGVWGGHSQTELAEQRTQLARTHNAARRRRRIA